MGRLLMEVRPAGARREYRAWMTGTTDGQAEAETAGSEDGSVLARISTEMVRTFKQYYGKGPVSAKSYLVDDLLFVVMREGITQAEQTMLDAGRASTVRNFRQEFENELVSQGNPEPGP
jgi:hypothetical protein